MKIFLKIISFYIFFQRKIILIFLGCLMSCAWRDERCRIGLILGTGTNACYLEEIKDIHTIDQNAYNDKNGHMVINTEWV